MSFVIYDVPWLPATSYEHSLLKETYGRKEDDSRMQASVITCSCCPIFIYFSEMHSVHVSLILYILYSEL